MIKGIIIYQSFNLVLGVTMGQKTKSECSHDSQSGRGTQADTYSDRTRPQGASSDPREGARHGTSCLGAGRSGQSDRDGRGMERRHPPRKNVSSICCPVTSTDRRFDWPDVLRLPSSHLGCGRPDCVADDAVRSEPVSPVLP
jgi:hypothetical protein